MIDMQSTQLFVFLKNIYLYRVGAPSSARLSTLLLGGGFNQLPDDVPSELSGAMLLDRPLDPRPPRHCHVYSSLMSHVRMDVLRQKGIAPSHSLSRTGRRPRG